MARRNRPNRPWLTEALDTYRGRVFTLQVIWGLCLAVAAMVIGVGLELHSSGAGMVLSCSVVVAGVLLVPLSSAAIERVIPITTPE
jgi:hypothetical protein